MMVRYYAIFTAGVVLGGCGTVKETTRLQPVGPPVEFRSFEVESVKAEASVEKQGQTYVVLATNKTCRRETISSTQEREQVVERTTDPTAGSLALYGLGALAAGSAIAIFGQCDSDCSAGRALAAVGGVGAFAGLEIGALVNAFRSIDTTKPAEPDHNTRTTERVNCESLPAKSRDVFVIRASSEFVGNTDKHGRLEIDNRLIRELAMEGRTYSLRVGTNTTALNLDAENNVYCRKLADGIEDESAIARVEKALNACARSSSNASVRRRLDELYIERDRRADEERRRTLEEAWARTNASEPKSLQAFIGVCNRVGDGPHCADARHSIRDWKTAAAVASCGLLWLGENSCNEQLENQVGTTIAALGCNALLQKLDGGKVSGFEMLVSAGTAHAAKSDSEVVRLVGAGVQVVQFFACVDQKRRAAE